MKTRNLFKLCANTFILTAAIAVLTACSGSSSSSNPFENVANSLNNTAELRKAIISFYKSQITAEIDEATPTGLTLTSPFKITKAVINKDGGVDYQMAANIKVIDRQRVNDDFTEPRIVGVGDNNLIVELRGKTFVNNQVLILYGTINNQNAPTLAQIKKIIVCSRNSQLFKQAR